MCDDRHAASNVCRCGARCLGNKMIDIKTADLELYRECLKNRNDDPSAVDKILELNEERKKLIQDVEAQKADRNRVTQEIAVMKRNKEDATAKITSMKDVGSQIKKCEDSLEQIESRLSLILESLPNFVHNSVPVGKSEEENVEIRVVGEKPKFLFEPKEHFDLGEKLGILDFERASKISGSRFVALKGMGARLERALYNFMLDTHTGTHDYTETVPPYIVNSSALFGTGQFPKFVDDVFHLKDTDYHLIPTAEVPVTNYYSGEILSESDLPMAFTAFTPCFRSEAGSYGKDTKGLIRQHQFNKVELVRFSHPDDSYEQLEKLTSHAEKILNLLGLPYRVMALCTGDIGFGATKTYDLEVWLPGQSAYREISSCSNCEDFQARRAGIRFRPEGGGKPQFVHTLNGSGLAVGRTMVAILENYQNEDGSIDIPEALRPYFDGSSRISN